MSRTKKGSKSCGYDYWSKRCFGNMCMGYGKVAKEITHKKERELNKKIVFKAIKEDKDE